MDDATSPPLLTVVRGEDVREAVLATVRFVKSKPAPTSPIGPDDKSTSKRHWLFVYVGHDSSSPPQWLIHPPTVFSKKVRFTYTRFDGWFSGEQGEKAADANSYLYWVPLGEIADPSELRAELVELSKTVKATYPPKEK